MKVNKKLCLFMVMMLGILLAGCYAAPASETALETTISASDDVTMELPLPDGFALESQPDGNYAIIRDGQVVGGLAQNDLMKTDLVAYLQTYVHPPLVMEYIYGSGKDNVWLHVDLIAYDPETETAHETSHYLFEKDGKMYDLFLDNERMEWETEKQILETSGLYLPEE